MEVRNTFSDDVPPFPHEFLSGDWYVHEPSRARESYPKLLAKPMQSLCGLAANELGLMSAASLHNEEDGDTILRMSSPLALLSLRRIAAKAPP